MLNVDDEDGDEGWDDDADDEGWDDDADSEWVEEDFDDDFWSDVPEEDDPSEHDDPEPVVTKPTVRQYLNHIVTGTNIMVTFNDGSVIVNNTHKNYKALKAALNNKEWDKIAELADIGSAIKCKSDGYFELVDGVVKHDGVALPQVLSDRLLSFLEKGFPCKALQAFWENLSQNPSLDSRNELYTFLEVNHIPITEDGYFIGYKYVTKDFKDYHTKTFDNRPGKIVKEDRSLVNPNRSDLCVRGLHVASWEYASKTFPKLGRENHPESWEDGRLVEVKVNPKDVVTVPTDYNGTKMRVCEYEVLCEVKSPTDDKIMYTKRTYYYKGYRNKPFKAKLVTSHKPGHFSLTVRAKDTPEAIKLMEAEFK